MTFGIEGQYRMSVTIGDYEDFLTEDKFEKFVLIENTGLSLPYWELRFTCVFPELLRYFNEKQPILVQLGTTSQNVEPVNLVIKKPVVIPESSDSSSVILYGFTSKHQYLENEYKQSYPDATSFSCAQQIAKKYGWQFKSNISNTNDKMTYYQPGESDYKFLFNTWLHSYYADNDLIIPTITTKDILKYDSVMQLIADFDPEKAPTFVDNNPEKDEILVNANTGSESNTTITNMFGNYVKDRYIFDIETGLFTHVNIENNTPLISESKTNSVDESISRSSGFYVQSSNVHKNFYKQELINTQKYFSLQSSKQWVSVADKLVSDIYPGDLAMYMSKKGNNQVNDQISGMYLVNRRVVSIKDRKVHTNFQLIRENMNYSK
jgi:hypothetical protein